MLKALVPKFRPDLLANLKDIAEKQVPREAETDTYIATKVRYVKKTING